MEPVALKLLGEPNTNLSNPPRDMRFGSRGSMAVDYENGRWFDHENQVGGGVLDLIAYKTGCNTGEAQAWLRREGIGPAGRTPSPPPCHRAPAVRTIGKFVEAIPTPTRPARRFSRLSGTTQKTSSNGGRDRHPVVGYGTSMGFAGCHIACQT